VHKLPRGRRKRIQGAETEAGRYTTLPPSTLINAVTFVNRKQPVYTMSEDVFVLGDDYAIQTMYKK
jgi:hypothetical protein